MKEILRVYIDHSWDDLYLLFSFTRHLRLVTIIMVRIHYLWVVLEKSQVISETKAATFKYGSLKTKPN